MAKASASSLPTLISVATVLTGTDNKTNQSPNLATVLQSRLLRAYELMGEDDDSINGDPGLEKLQYITARVSLNLVERIQSILAPAELDSSTSTEPPQFGTRDLSQVRTLLSIFFKWAIRPLSNEFEIHHLGHSMSSAGQPYVIDLTERQLNFEDLPLLLSRLFSLIFTSGDSPKIRETWITTSILHHHAVDMLSPCLLLGWSSKHISDSLDDTSKRIKLLSVQFINLLRTHEAITALGAILSSSTNNRTPLTHVSKACAHLLSNQLKRPDGVRGLCVAIFGEETESSEAVSLEKMEHIARVLRTVPSNTKSESYFQFIIPRILELLLPTSFETTPSSHKRAAAFALSRMVSPTFQHNAVASSILLPLLHKPFLSPNCVGHENEVLSSPPATRMPRMSPTEVLRTLQTFLLHMDPSPAEVSILVTPIVPELFTLLALYRSSKTADPTIRESLDSLLNVWGRIVSFVDVIDGLCSIVDGAGGNWELDPEGFSRSSRPMSGPSISLLAAAELERSSKHDINIHSNHFNLRPDPSEFVAFLRSLDRQEVASEVFVRLLNEYRELKETKSDPIRTLLHVQLILQLQSQLSTTILSRPEHVLSFIKHALASESLPQSLLARDSTLKKGLGLEDLRIVDKEESEGGDSDDASEDDGEGQVENDGGKDEMVVTAITLLLSILEGNSDISPHTNPDLEDLLNPLNNFSSHPSPVVRQLAREARLVLTARTASTSSNASTSTARPTVKESTREEYQKALKLLQDPIIPVRAHGLQLLRDLVSGRPALGSKTSQTGRTVPLLDPALIPGILSIFLQSIQDEESYIFLNAVQGLAAMVDGYGKDVLRGVMDVYLSGTGVRGSGGFAGSPAMSKEELDARIRVGEALNAVVKRCGSALGVYVDILVPPLLAMLRSSGLPTILRTSALAVLAQCIETHAPAMTTYTLGLADACVELIKLESVPEKSSPAVRNTHETASAKKVAVEDDVYDSYAKRPARGLEPTDVDPVTSNAKVVAFRRSALHLLSQLLRAHTAMIYDARRISAGHPTVTLSIGRSSLQDGTVWDAGISESFLKRAAIVLGYVAATDEDVITRIMAKETLEVFEQYREASLGFQ